MEIGYHQFPNGKQYTFIKKEGKPVFLRNVIFILNAKNNREIAIVREWGKGDRGTWESPKGQMEWKEIKDMRPNSIITPNRLIQFMRAGVMREMVEEAKIMPNEIRNLKRMPIVYMEAWPESGVKNAEFLYQFWQAKMDPKSMLEAQKRMHTLVKNPDWKHILPHDVTEKDAVEWWKPEDGWQKIRGAFSKKITKLYFTAKNEHT